LYNRLAGIFAIEQSDQRSGRFSRPRAMVVRGSLQRDIAPKRPREFAVANKLAFHFALQNPAGKFSCANRRVVLVMQSPP
jgi:hypothetical protein